jgi:hypothetical protein
MEKLTFLCGKVDSAKFILLLPFYISGVLRFCWFQVSVYL